MNNKIRFDLIEDKMKDVSDSIEVIERNLPAEFGDFSSLELIKEGIYKKIEFAIESIIDICSIINSDLRIGSPEDESDILDNLEIKKIFSKKIISLIREMKGFRNYLVHKYGDVDDKKAYDNIVEGLDDFDKIISEIEKFIEERKDLM